MQGPGSWHASGFADRRKGFSLIVWSVRVFRAFVLVTEMSIRVPVGTKILVVDDEAAIRCVLSEILSGSGLDVVSAGCAEEALRLFDDCRVSLTLTDRNMPGMGGVELAMLLKKRAPGHPVLMVSGMASDGLSREEGVVDGFLMKPFSRASVLDGVRKVLGLRGDF